MNNSNDKENLQKEQDNLENLDIGIDDEIELNDEDKKVLDSMEVEFVDGEIFNEFDINIENNDNYPKDDMEGSSKNEEDIKMIEKFAKDIKKKEYPEFIANGEIYSIALLQEKGIAIVGDGEEYTYLYNIESKTLITKEKFHKDSVIAVKVSSDGKYFLTASMDGTACIFDTESLKVVTTVEGSNEEIMVF